MTLNSRMSNKMEKYFVIGQIVNTQGIKGEMRVVPSTDDITRFERLDYVYVERRGELAKMNITSVRYHKQFVLIKLEGVNDMTAAEGFKGAYLKVTEDMAIPCAENEYYIRDLLGMTVKTPENEVIGTLSDVIETGANDVYVVKREGKKDLLLPAIKSCITNVDVENNVMLAVVPEGLEP